MYILQMFSNFCIQYRKPWEIVAFLMNIIDRKQQKRKKKWEKKKKIKKLEKKKS